MPEQNSIKNEHDSAVVEWMDPPSPGIDEEWL